MRCHGLEAISGGITPDLRELNTDYVSLASARQKETCYGGVPQYFIATVRHGHARGGHVYISPFEGVLTQEAVWPIETYLESRHVQEQQVGLPPLATLRADAVPAFVYIGPLIFLTRKFS